MASDIKKLRDNVRAQWFDWLEGALVDEDCDILRTASNELAIPVVDSEGNEHYVVFIVKIPTGSRDGEPYDGYAAAEDYAMKCEAKARKAEEKERKSAERKAKSKTEET
jgi:hypothetical protein